MSMTVTAELERWPLITPFRITGFTWEFVEVVVVSVHCDGQTGRGEGAGVYYTADRPEAMIRQVESVRGALAAGLNRDFLQWLLPRGGARNALDCAMWDLESKLESRPAWQIAGLNAPQALLSTLTCGADEPDKMAATARGYVGARAIKVKLTGEPIDAERVRAVRAAREDVWLGIDANQGFSRAFLEKLMPVLVAARVALIEQPFPVGQESLLEGFQSPIPIAADESAQGLEDIFRLPGRFNVANIKLDKCGGLTEALAMARAAAAVGLEVMVGNMLGTSLAMAPAFLVGQLCRVVDLDGPVFLKADRDDAVDYSDGFIRCPNTLWGGGGS
jgi:L-alanine-DL-glutamate epimerase-like enolase superfamily enzyme